MSISPICDRCDREFDRLGGLAFSPPLDSMVRKFHVCDECWPEFLMWLVAAPVDEHPPTAEVEQHRLTPSDDNPGWPSRMQIPQAHREGSVTADLEDIRKDVRTVLADSVGPGVGQRRETSEARERLHRWVREVGT